MAKITLPTIAAGYASNTAFNTAYDLIEAEFQNKVLYRNNTSGETNTMSQALDMNSNNISQLSRLISVKEQHAKEVKNEVATIWGDYFKKPQISKYPEIHELVHSIMQLASKCKQENTRENGVELLKNVNKFTEIFWNTKDIKTEKKFAPYPPELVIVCPVLKNA